MLERARRRREAVKARLKEASVVTASKRSVEIADNNENNCADDNDDDVDEGTTLCTVQNSKMCNWQGTCYTVQM